MRYLRQDILAVGLDMFRHRVARNGFYSEGMPGHHLSAVACTFHGYALDGFGFHAELRRPCVIFEYLLEFGVLVPASFVHSVESLSVFSWPVIDFQLAVVGYLEFVGGLANLCVGLDLGLGFEVFLWHLEAIVPQGIFAGGYALAFLPIVNDVFFQRTFGQFPERYGAPRRQVGVSTGGVGDDHLMPTLGMFEVIVDPFFFHESRGEVEVGFPVLDTVITIFVIAFQLELDVQTFEYLFENISDFDVLEDSTLGPAGPQPKEGNDLHVELGKFGSAFSLAESTANSIEESLVGVGHLECDRDGLAEDLVESDLSDLVVGRKQFQMVVEELRNAFASGKPFQK